MIREEIISKGFYTRPQLPGVLSVKQYIILRRRNKKMLLLRMENHRDEVVTAISYAITQYDVKGNVIARGRVERKDICWASHGVISLDEPFMLKSRCVDFSVEIQAVSYGSYVYEAREGEWVVRYEKKEELEPVDLERVSDQMQGETHTVSHRTLRAGKTLLRVGAVLVLALLVAVGVQLYHFMRTETIFTLDSVDYSFETDDRQSGPICVEGYRGNAGNIIIPEKIEGHQVARIAASAFEGSHLRSIVIEGATAIDESAFFGSNLLKEVTLNKATGVGKFAFADCLVLEAVTLGEGLEKIDAYAFKNCRSLNSISLPKSLIHIGDGAFMKCQSLVSIALPDNASSIGNKILSGCQSLQSLSTPYLGENKYDPSTLEYFFDGSPTNSLTSVTITKDDTAYANMFKGMSSIQTIVFLKDIRSIGSSAFDGCSSLIAFEIPDTVESIGVGAFRDCRSLKSIEIPDSVESISAETFKNCISLESVVLPASIKTVDRQAFYGCKSLKKVELPKAVSTIGEKAFQGCSALEELTVPFLGMRSSSPAAASVLFGGEASSSLKKMTIISGSKLVEGAFENFKGLETVVLPDGMTEIEKSAFENCAALKSVYIPKSVSKIGESAFNGCKSLESIVLPDALTILNASLFKGCSVLAGVDIPDQVETIAESAFENCSALEQVELPNQIRSIGASAFRNCSALKSMVLPSAIKEIRSSTFEGCSSLSDFVLPNTVEKIQSKAFASCNSLKNVTVPDGVLEIGDSAYMNCLGLQSFTISDTVRSVGSAILQGCTSLKELKVSYLGSSASDNSHNLSYYFGSGYAATIPNSLQKLTVTDDTELPQSAFAKSKGLREVVLPVGLRTIPQGAFSDCTALISFAIPNGVTTIQSEAFKGCVALETLVIPDSVTSIPKNMLSGCTAMVSLTLPTLNDRKLSELFGGTVPTAMKTVVLTNETEIVEDAFSNCSSIESIYLNEGLESIGENAFYGCSSLKSLSIPKSVQLMERGVFESCNALEELTLPFVGGSRASDCGLNYLFSYNSYYYPNVPSALKKVTITDMKNIPSNAFYDCGNIEQIILSNNAETIGSNAFCYCSKLESMLIPENVTDIGDWAFNGCERLLWIENRSGLNLDSMRSWLGLDQVLIICENGVEPTFVQNADGYEFLMCDDGWYLVGYYGSETALVLPTSFDYEDETILEYHLPNYLFQNNEDIVSVRIPDSVISIGKFAFHNCINLTEVVFSGNSRLTVIKEYAFASNSKLEEISIPEGVELIESYSIYACGALKSVTIPSTVTEIGYYAFGGCDSLDEIYNLSALDMEIGSYDHGQIALNAIIIHDSLSAEKLHVVTVNKLNFKKSDDFWLLIGTDESLTELKLSSFTYEGKKVSSYKIHKNAFQYNNSLQRLVIDNAVSTIGAAAFSSCYNLQYVDMSANSVITYLPSDIFRNCSALTTALLPVGIERIGVSAFYGCSHLEKISIPDSVIEIGEYAFYGCSVMERVELSANLEDIGDYAFEGCHMLVEVCNPSNLNIVVGDTDFGYVAKYAIAVHSSKTAEANKDVVTNMQYEFRLMQFNGRWYLYDCEKQTGSSNIIYLPKTLSNGKSISYCVLDYRAIDSWYGLSGIMIPACVKSVDSKAMQQIAYYGKTVYYEGTSSQWNALTSAYSVTVKYYKTCVHEGEDGWMYDGDGKVTTTPPARSEVVAKKPTCAEEGVLNRICTNCNDIQRQAIEKLQSHTEGANGKCAVCHATVEFVTDQNFETLSYLANDVENPFTIDANGKICSASNNRSFTAKLKITATQDMVVVFSCGFSAVNYNTYINVICNSMNVASIGATGGSDTQKSIQLSAGDELELEFKKNSSYTNVVGYIANLQFVLS